MKKQKESLGLVEQYLGIKALGFLDNQMDKLEEESSKQKIIEEPVHQPSSDLIEKYHDTRPVWRQKNHILYSHTRKDLISRIKKSRKKQHANLIPSPREYFKLIPDDCTKYKSQLENFSYRKVKLNKEKPERKKFNELVNICVNEIYISRAKEEKIGLCAWGFVALGLIACSLYGCGAFDKKVETQYSQRK